MTADFRRLVLVESNFLSMFSEERLRNSRLKIQQEGIRLEGVENFLSARAAINRTQDRSRYSLCP